MTETVLYVEDNEDNARLVERILKRRPHVDLIVAVTGQAGLDRALDATPSLILLDRRLPDMPGNEVLRRLKATSDTAPIPVVMLSGDSASDSGGEIRGLGAEEFLAKPFDIHQLLAIVDRFCRPPTT
jgi:DNA-binding response OmpR family regulator